MYNVYKISIGVSPLECWDWFFYATHTLPPLLIALATINKLKENYFLLFHSAFLIRLPQLSHILVLLFRMSTAGNIIAYVLQWLRNIIVLFYKCNSFLFFSCQYALKSNYFPDMLLGMPFSLFSIILLATVNIYPKKKLKLRI